MVYHSGQRGRREQFPIPGDVPHLERGTPSVIDQLVPAYGEEPTFGTERNGCCMESWSVRRSVDFCRQQPPRAERRGRPEVCHGGDLLGRAKANGFTGVVLADSAYGDVTEFRQTLAVQGWRYCVGVGSTLKVVAAAADLGEVPPYGGRGRPPSRPAKVLPGAASASVQGWARDRKRDFRKVTWREGSKGKMASRFAAWRVRPAHRLSAGRAPLGPAG